MNSTQIQNKNSTKSENSIFQKNNLFSLPEEIIVQILTFIIFENNISYDNNFNYYWKDPNNEKVIWLTKLRLVSKMMDKIGKSLFVIFNSIPFLSLHFK